MWLLWLYLIGIPIAWVAGAFMMAGQSKEPDSEERVLLSVLVFLTGVIWPLTLVVFIIASAATKLRERLDDAKEKHDVE